MKMALTGADAAAYAMKQINPDVLPMYPITPQTQIVMKFSEYVANGEVNTELITAESEHSAMSSAIGSSAAGARTMTATSSNGLALMHEIVYIASSMRLPIVMNVVNRALSGPINIHCDHSDSMAERDSGWIQIYNENPQEVYDHNLMAIKLSEDSNILLPTMVLQDGFITSHAMESLNVEADSKVKSFIGKKKYEGYLLDSKNPKTFGAIDLTDYYMEHKYQQHLAIKEVEGKLKTIYKEFEEKFGRKYNVIEEYNTKDSEIVFVAMSSSCGTIRHRINEMKKDGYNVGLIKVRLFRPFPIDEIVKALKDKKKIIVLDRANSPGAIGGPLYEDIVSATKDYKLNIYNIIYGLGGRNFAPKDVDEILLKVVKNQPFVDFHGVRR
ncbi:MAG: transketolase C-terminal domain-containing protein [Candidatus Nanoarchaeia archaeon]|nr:transketolase C-terminal domain-containing protein [Candidatus Nanoarchaeia archaeon]